MSDLLITRAFLPEILEQAGGSLDVEQGVRNTPMPRAELLRRVRFARALIAYGTDRVDAEVLDAASALRIVAAFGVGYDNVDVEEATRRGVWVTNTPDVLTDATADVTMLLILAVLRRAAEAFEFARHGSWTSAGPDLPWGTDPEGLTLGILGLGRIGRAVAGRAGAFRMRVTYHSRQRLPEAEEQALAAEWMPLGELLKTADVLSVHVPLAPDTRGLLGAAELSLMHPGSFLVNTSRGPVIDEAALFAALESGRLGGVGLDVYANEPVIPPALREHPRAFCLPHVGSATLQTRQAMMRLCLANVANVLGGEPPLTPVNRV
ncbi:MAG: D-glycerate dehydrogenase [Chloroflexi bacterium]|nr:D-glycerate dehydrogenase [Chloroflexota bacterium]